MATQRITRDEIDERAANVSRRLRNNRSYASPGDRMVITQGRNGYIGLDEYVVTTRTVDGMADGSYVMDMVRTLTTGTKREVGDFLHAMMVGMDLAATVELSAVES